MVKASGLSNGLAQLTALAPGGYALGLHIRFASAQIMVNTYDPKWVEVYASRGYMLCDPLISWGFGAEGCVRWSALNHPDPHQVLAQAAEFGLRFGIAVSYGPTTSRSIGGFARADREFTDAEMAEIAGLVAVLHHTTEPPSRLPPTQIEALRLVAQGLRYSEAAHRLGISESALKARLRNAREGLSCRTTPEAIQRALENKLL